MKTKRPPTPNLPDELNQAIALMMLTDGLYAVTDTASRSAVVPMAVVGGKLYSMKLDNELDPKRFLPTAKINGPLQIGR